MWTFVTAAFLKEVDVILTSNPAFLKTDWTALVMCPDFIAFPFQDKKTGPSVLVVTWNRITPTNMDIHDFSLSFNTIRAGP
jgi:hypothetical protein